MTTEISMKDVKKWRRRCSTLTYSRALLQLGGPADVGHLPVPEPADMLGSRRRRFDSSVCLDRRASRQGLLWREILEFKEAMPARKMSRSSKTSEACGPSGCWKRIRTLIVGERHLKPSHRVSIAIRRWVMGRWPPDSRFRLSAGARRSFRVGGRFSVSRL